MTRLEARDSWGWLIIISHWLSVIMVFALITLGLWMVDLTYYHSWYHKAPQLHKSLGMVLLLLTLARIAWRLLIPRPAPLSSHSRLEKQLAHSVHVLLYVLLLTIMFSGYLISTADGRGIEVFDWFEVPALFPGFDKQEDIAGEIHFWLAMSLLLVILFHGAAAIKHHFIDRDNTLKRIVWK